MARSAFWSAFFRLMTPLAVGLVAASTTAALEKQVVIETSIVSVRADDIQRLGLSSAALESILSANPLPPSALPTTGVTTLGSQSLSTSLGTPITLRAGGAIPPSQGGASPGTYAIQIEMTPTIGANGMVRLDLDALLPKVDLGQSPVSIGSRSATTNVDVPTGQTVVIGGLLQSDIERLPSAVPGISQVPVLGRLFSSERSKKDQSQLMVFVTPRIYDPETGSAGGGGGGGTAINGNDRNPSLVYGGFDYFGVQPSPAARPDFPLVTSKQLVLVDNPATNRPFQGELSGPNTEILYDDAQTGYPFASGLKAEVGTWFDRKSRFGFELNGFYVPETTTSSKFDSGASNSFLAVPFYDTSRNFEYSVVIGSALAGNPASMGSVDIGSSIDFWGAGGALRVRDIDDCDDLDIGLSAGFRYVRLAERFWIDYDTEPTVNTAFGQGTLGSYLFAGGALPAAGSHVHAQDDVQVENDFYGLDLGLDASVEMLPGLTFRVAPRVAIGASVQEADVFGSGTAWQPNGTMLSTPYGVFARQGYTGSQSRTEFAVVPEVDLEFRYQPLDWFAVSAGYNFFYMSNVAQAGDQLRREIDAPIDAFGAFSASPRAGAGRRFEGGSFYANSVRLGVRFTF